MSLAVCPAMRRQRLGATGIVATLGLLLCGFSSSATFEADAMRGGGGGYLYTGSPQSHGMDCTNCHQGSSRSDGVTLWSEPAGLFETGYVADTTYVVHVKLDIERRGLTRQGACAHGLGGCNRNSFVAEWRDEAGAPAGTLCVDGATFGVAGCESDVGDETLLMAKGLAIGGHSQRKPRLCGGAIASDCIDVAALKASGASDADVNAAIVAAVRGRVQWRFQWRPAASATGPIRLFLGLVDGDGGTSVDPHHNDYQGDDVLMVDRVLRRQGDAVAPSPGCSASGRFGGASPTTGLDALDLGLLGPALLGLGAVALLLLRRRWLCAQV